MHVAVKLRIEKLRLSRYLIRNVLCVFVCAGAVSLLFVLPTVGIPDATTTTSPMPHVLD